MRVAFTYNLNTGAHEWEAEFDSHLTVDALNLALSKHYEVIPVQSTNDHAKFVEELLDSKADVIFNVAEGFIGHAREAFYPALFDQLGIPFTGPDATNLIICHNKILTKHLLSHAGLTVPKGVIIKDGKIKMSQFINWRFPLIVKLNSEGSGIGLSKDSIVNNITALEAQVRKIWETYHKPLIIEEYIIGRDMSMTFVEGLGALGPCEILCTDNHIIYDYEHKTSKDHLVIIKSPKDIPQQWQLNLKMITEQAATVLDIRGYAKLDFRVTERGEAFILEVNGQVSFHPLGEFMVCVESEGYNLENIVNHIIQHAKNQSYQNYSVGFNI